MDVFKNAIRFCLIALLPVVSGCASVKLGSYWLEGGSGAVVDPWAVSRSRLDVLRVDGNSASDRDLRLCWEAYDQAKQREVLNRDDAVEGYYRAALIARRVIATTDYRFASSSISFETAHNLYHESLRRFLYLANQKKRISPGVGIRLCGDTVPEVLPFNPHGFHWNTSDFSELCVVGNYANSYLTDQKKETGVGVPVVVVRDRCRAMPILDAMFVPELATFPATIMLSCDGRALEVINPLVTERLEVDGFSQPLASDMTADIAYSLQFHESSRLEGFLRPGTENQEGELIFFEPFQANKIPVVFVHGLLSSPDAWADVFNELRADKSLREKYQFWAFRYSTGEPFVKSAAELRRKLDQVSASFSSLDIDSNLEKTILIGHSMGGLVSKVLISESQNRVWNAIANVPLDNLVADPRTKATLADRLFFSPHPMISRVVYIATPHQGSEMAGRLLGRIASASIEPANETHSQILKDNPGAFKSSISRGLPTSIDMLDPEQPFLDVLSNLPRDRCVVTNTILGDGRITVTLERSDGVVSVRSAQQRASESEKRIAATHNGLLQHSDTFAELKRILKIHQ
jgi:pimeloyl-ACP methyl ester carboxylesterase